MLTAVCLSTSAAAAADKLDAYGDPLPEGALARLGTLRLRTASTVIAVSISPDGKKLAAIDRYRILRVWRVSDAKLVLKQQVDFMPLAVAFDAEGNTVAWACSDGAIGVTALDEKQKNRTFQNIDKRLRVAVFSADAALLATSGFTSGIQVWDMSEGKSVMQVSDFQGLANALAISPDKSLLALAGHNNKVGAYCTEVWEIATAKLRFRLKPDSRQAVTSLAFCLGGNHLAIAYKGGKTRLWDAKEGKPGPLLTEEAVAALAATPDGKRIAGKTARGIVLWDAASGKEVPNSTIPARRTTCLAFSADGSLVVVGGPGNAIGVWQLDKPKQVLRLPGHTHLVSAVAFTPSGDRIISASHDGTIRRWNIADGKEIVLVKTAPGSGERFTAISGDLKTAVSVKGGYRAQSIAVWDLAKAKKISGWTVSGSVLSTAISGDGQLLAVGTSNGLTVRHAATGAILLHIGLPYPRANVKGARGVLRWTHRSLAFSPDGKTIASGDYHGVRLYELATGGILATLVTKRELVQSVGFSADGRKLACGVVKKGVFIWDPLNESRLSVIPEGQFGITAVAFSADGRKLATGGRDTTVLVWNVPQPKATTSPQTKPTVEQEALQAAYVDLSGEDAAKAYKAMRVLVAAGEPAAALLNDRLKPLPAAAKTPNIEQLIADLDDDSFKVRDAATAKLAAIGEMAREQLQKALAETKSLEVAARAGRLLKDLVSPKAATAEARFCTRAIQVLEMIGTATAAKTLDKLARGGPGRITTDAKAALARLKRQRELPKR